MLERTKNVDCIYVMSNLDIKLNVITWFVVDKMLSIVKNVSIYSRILHTTQTNTLLVFDDACGHVPWYAQCFIIVQNTST